MTARSFNGGTSDWYLASSWTPPGPVQPGDVLTIASGDATISAADVTNFGSLNNEQVLIGSPNAASPATFSADGAVFGSGFAIDSVGAGLVAVNLTGSVAYAGSIVAATSLGQFDITVGSDATGQSLLSLTGSLGVAGGDDMSINGGTVVVAGQVNVANGALLFGADTTVMGTGTISIGAGGSLEIDGPVNGGTIDFLGNAETLTLADPLQFNGTVTGFVKGDAIDLVNAPSYKWYYNPNTHYLTVYGSNATDYTNPEVAEFILTGDAALTTSQIFVGQDGQGGSLIQLAEIRDWYGGNGDWYQSSNWTTTGTTAPNSYPLFGDTAVINGGSVTISAADFVSFGALDNEIVELAGPGASLTAVEGTFGNDLTIASGASQAVTSLTVGGIVTSSASIDVTGAGTVLRISATNDGTIAGDLINTSAGRISVSSEAGLDVTGRLTNDGDIRIRGGATIEAGGTIDGTGVIELKQSGITLTVQGSIAGQQSVFFNSNDMVLAPGAVFAGIVENFANGDTIDLQGTVANYASFDAGDNILTIRNGGSTGSVVASFNVAGNYGATDFAVTSDGDGGTFITDTVVATTQTLYATLPAPAVVAALGTLSLTQLLINSFGTDYLAAGSAVQLWSPSIADLDSFSFWDPNDPQLPYWTVNGTVVPPDTFFTVDASDISAVTYVGGDLIEAGATVQIPVAFTNGAPTGFIDYDIQDFAPQFAQPSLTGGAPTPQDVVNAASAFAAAYTNVPNTEDCWNIACEVAAAAGATMPYYTFSTYPPDNSAGGFWRIAYAAPQDGSAVSNWSTLVEAGDILRIGWANNGGPHSFTVVDGLDQSGSITVFDNIYYGNDTTYEAIGIHQANYWTQTDSEDITIYRLDPNSLYLVDYLLPYTDTLIQNVGNAIVQGTTFNDLIIPSGSFDIINGGGGRDVIADTSAVLNGATITDFGVGDTIDLTDLDASTSAAFYNPNTGTLTIETNGSVMATVLLPTDLTGTFEIGNLGGTAGLDGGLLGTLYQTLFANAAVSGATVALVTCFVAGTTIATPDGPVAVETLSVDDAVCCADGRTQRICWVGRRRVDLNRHPRPEAVLPIRIMQDAFAVGVPARPLLLSPDHAVFVDGILIPVRYLVNGATIEQMPRSAMACVTYYHIELPRHDVVWAEGLTVESYLDTGDRDRFETGGRPITLFPDFSSRVWDALGCAPLHITGRAVDRVRARLARRAQRHQRRGRLAA